MRQCCISASTTWVCREILSGALRSYKLSALPAAISIIGMCGTRVLWAHTGFATLPTYAHLGLGTCWVGFFDTPKINEAFPQTVGYDLVGLFPTGHADPEKGGPSPRHTQRKELADYVKEL